VLSPLSLLKILKEASSKRPLPRDVSQFVFVSLLLSTAVFAATDEAFDKIANLDEILSDPGNVNKIGNPTTFIVRDVYMSDKLVDGFELFTIGQQSLKFSVVGDDIMVIGAKIVTADITGTNGVAHAIDQVLGIDLPLKDPAPALNSTSAVNSTSSTPTAPSPTAETAGALTVSHLVALIGSLAMAAGINAL
jgi:hypothetical protein